jgi:hypothetical protein
MLAIGEVGVPAVDAVRLVPAEPNRLPESSIRKLSRGPLLRRTPEVKRRRLRRLSDLRSAPKTCIWRFHPSPSPEGGLERGSKTNENPPSGRVVVDPSRREEEPST